MLQLPPSWLGKPIISRVKGGFVLQLPPWQSPRELPRRTIRKIAPRRFISISLRYWHQSRRTVTSQKLVAPLARLWIFTLVHLGTEKKGKEGKQGRREQAKDGSESSTDMEGFKPSENALKVS